MQSNKFIIIVCVPTICQRLCMNHWNRNIIINNSMSLLSEKRFTVILVNEPSFDLLVLPSDLVSSCFTCPGSDVMNVASCADPFLILIHFSSSCICNSLHMILSLPVFDNLSRNNHMVLASGY